MAARIGGAITALVLAILLAWTVYASFGPEHLVLPTGGVIDSGPQDEVPASAVASEVLRQRTELQRWRGVSGPAPGEPADTTGKPALLEGESAAADPWTLVQDWLGTRERNFAILDDRGFLRGVVNLPDPRGEVLQQPQGRDWRRLHNDQVTYGGGWVIFGFALLLALFLAIRGRIPLKEGFSGRKVERFPAVERANHWLTAASFVMIALTGLVLLYGQYFIKPWLGADAYSGFAEGSAYVHMAFMVPFVIGVLIMAVLWLRQNLPSKIDWNWLKHGGGFLSTRGENPPARRFNAGQKLMFWAVMFGGGLLILSGIALMLPFFLWLNIQAMQWVQIGHAALGLIMIAVIIGHIYIGTVGMVGAFDAMWSGEVDRNWAKEHHRLWFEELEGEGRVAEPREARRHRHEPHAVPGE
jgi:formate dehydrogenase subunit gamma